MPPSNQDDRDDGVDDLTPRERVGAGTLPPSLAKTQEADEDTPLPDLRQGRAQRRIEDLVLQQLFDVEPESQSIGRYRVLDQIGRGGMGTVLAAYDEQLDRKVAIKVLDANGSPSSAASLRLKREAQALARLSHPNVVTVHEVGESDGEVYVVMEFLRGQSLDGWIKERPDWRTVLEVFDQAGRGIMAAHAVGLIHRDLKPHNIMRTEDGAVKVLDFGLVRSDDADAEEADEEASNTEDSAFDDHLTRTGALLGTPAYMAPEQHRGEPADARTDQYGFCAALYEALYGCLPFDGATLQEMIVKIIRSELTPPPPDSRVPAWVHRVVTRGLSRRRADRWPSMQALLHALARDPARIRRRRMTIAGLGLVTGLGGYALSQLQTAAQEACPTAGDEAEALWSSQRRNAITAAFSATGNRLAVDTLERTAEPIGAYVDALGLMRAQACEAHRKGQESNRLFDLRTACLDVRRAGFEQLMQQFEHADAATVDNAAWAVASLPRVDPCGDAEALTAAVAPPDDPQIAEQVQHQREALASARSMSLAGAHDDAAHEAEDVLLHARGLGYTPLVAEAELRLGDILREGYQHQPAYEVLSRGVRSALSSMHYEAAVEALALRMWIVGDPLGRPEDALHDDDIADAMIETLGRPARLQWLLLNNRAVAQFRSGALTEAERSYHEALSAAQSLGEHALPVEVISTRANLAILEFEGLGRPDLAAEELRSARSRATELLGPEHPRVFMLTSMLAEFLGFAGRRDQALLEFELARRQPPPDAYSQIKLLVELARVHQELRRFPAALEAAAEALALAREAIPDDYLCSIALMDRGMARVGLGDVDDGLRDLFDAVKREEKRIDHTGDSVAVAHLWVGLGLRQAGRLDEAIAHLELSLSLTTALGPASQSQFGYRAINLMDLYLERGDLSSAETLLARINEAQDAAGFSPQSRHRLLLAKLRGDLLRAKGERSAARATYELACEGLAAQAEARDLELVACRLALSQVLDDTDRARALATTAASAYRQLGEAFEPEHQRALGVVARLGGSAEP